MDFAKEVPSVTFSMNDDTADVFVTKANFTMWETDVTIQTPAGKLQITSALIGRHNLPNILAAVATGLALTIDDDGIPLKVRPSTPFILTLATYFCSRHRFDCFLIHF